MDDLALIAFRKSGYSKSQKGGNKKNESFYLLSENPAKKRQLLNRQPISSWMRVSKNAL